MNRRRRKQKDDQDLPEESVTSEESTDNPSLDQPVSASESEESADSSVTETQNYRAPATKKSNSKAIEIKPRARLAAPSSTDDNGQEVEAKAPTPRKKAPFDNPETDSKTKFKKEDVPPVPSAIGDSDWGEGEHLEEIDLFDEPLEDETPEEELSQDDLQGPQFRKHVPKDAPDKDTRPIIPEKKTSSNPEATTNQDEESADAEGFRAIWKQALASLSTLEKASLGLLTAGLLVFGIWTISNVVAVVPENEVNARPKFPVTGESAVLQNVETFWKKPVLEGPNRDEGVSSQIELIPAARITLAENSKAKALRFLFRDEAGRLVGDAATLTIEGSQFVQTPGQGKVAAGNRAVATVGATDGFLHQGEIISYLSNQEFTWYLIILESADEVEFKEFLTMAISPRTEETK